jgi:hypothetical protein
MGKLSCCVKNAEGKEFVLNGLLNDGNGNFRDKLALHLEELQCLTMRSRVVINLKFILASIDCCCEGFCSFSEKKDEAWNYLGGVLVIEHPLIGAGTHLNIGQVMLFEKFCVPLACHPINYHAINGKVL